MLDTSPETALEAPKLPAYSETVVIIIYRIKDPQNIDMNVKQKPLVIIAVLGASELIWRLLFRLPEAADTDKTDRIKMRKADPGSSGPSRTHTIPNISMILSRTAACKKRNRIEACAIV